jgi:lysophospholipase L1-like esterase
VSNTKSAILILAILVAVILNLTASAENSKAGGHWVSAWSTAVHAPLPFPGLPPPPVFENQTIRMVVKPTIGGERVRVRFSNVFGSTALAIGGAHLALTRQGASTVSDTDHALTFGGRTSVNIPPGAPMLSDPVEFKLEVLTEITVSIFLPGKVSASSVHFWGQHDTYVSGPGDLTGKSELPDSTKQTSWYWLADVEVWAADDIAATVTFGDSITDGVGAKQGEYADWPDSLAVRLAETKKTAAMAVVNEGIGGNRILHDGAGVSALARFDRDVLAQPGVVNLIILEGINDIGFPHLKPRPPQREAPPNESPFADQFVSAQDLIGGLRQLIERAHQHGIRAFGATLTPFEGADYYSAEGEAIRQEVNQWIRTSGAFDGVFDFDAAVRDPRHPAHFLEQCDSGDHLHPSAAGFKAMAEAVDISVLRRGVVSQSKK